MAKNPVSQITDEKNGIKFVSFELHDDTRYSPKQRIWFVFHFENLLGKNIWYTSMGMAVHKWTGSEWDLHAYKQSYGGPNGRFPAKGRKHKDNWKVDQAGILALTPYVSFDKQASDKITKQNNPSAVTDVFHLGQPIYVKIGPSGGIIESPSAPLIDEKKIEDPPEVTEPEIDDQSDDKGLLTVDPPDRTVGKDGSAKTEVGDTEDSKALTGSQISVGMSALSPLVLHSGTGEISRQVIEWTPGSGVDAVRIDMSRRQGDRWATHTSLTEALDANNRVELIFMEAGSEITTTTLIDDSRATDGRLSGAEEVTDDTKGTDDKKGAGDTKGLTGLGDVNPLDELPLLVPSTILLDIEFVSQSGNDLLKDCGPACIAMLAENSIVMALKQSGGQKNKALNIKQVRKALSANKIGNEYKEGLTVGQVRESVRQNKPVILLINYDLVPAAVRQIKLTNFDHFAVVVGADDKGIFIHDPLGTGNTGGRYSYLTDPQLEKSMSKMFWKQDPRQGILITKTYDRLLSGELTSGYVHEDYIDQKAGIAITDGRPNMRWEPIASKNTLMVSGLPRNKVMLVLDGEKKEGYVPIRTAVSKVKSRVVDGSSASTDEGGTKKVASGTLQTGMNVNPDASHGNPMDSDALKGLDWVRFPFKLAAREKQSERDDISKAFAQYDEVVSKYAKKGISSLIVLNQETVGGRVPWQLKDGDKITHPYSDEKSDWEEYAGRFAATAGQIAGHYREKGFADKVAFQIWNEGDLANNPASAYLKPEHMAIILDQASEAIHKEVPKATLIFNGMATGAGTAVKYIKKVQTALDGKLPVDALGVHPYGQYVTNRPFKGWGYGQIKEYLKIYRDQFPDIPIWITEIGIAENNPLGSEHYKAISGYLKDIFTHVAQQQSDHVRVLIWFAWSDEMRNAGMVDRQGKVKEHVHAVFEQVRDRKII